MDPQRHVVWFSCGAASAALSKMVVGTVPHDRLAVVYCDTSRNEHPDNGRFLRDVERWTGFPVTVLSSEKYRTVEEVFEARRYMSGVRGAPCTVELKKKVRFAFQRADDIHYFGYTADERVGRRETFESNNPDLLLRWPLIEAGVTKAGCLQMLRDAGIPVPVMYGLGYKNNNCIGCVKATSMSYWRRIRRDFPDVFARRVTQSRDIGARLLQMKGKRSFLDELPPETALPALTKVLEDVSCGPECRGEA